MAAELRRELGEAVVAIVEAQGAAAADAHGSDVPPPATAPPNGEELSVEIRRQDIASVAGILRSRFRFTVLVDLCAVDFPQREPRFEVVYHLYSFRENRRLRLRVCTDEGLAVPSVSAVWRGADWPEREAYDLFGIEFADHPGLSRVLLWEGFAGHPLRKDFPLAGVDSGAALLPPEAPDEAR